MTAHLPGDGDEPLGESPLLIDEHLPRFDAALRAHQVADADRAATWEALRGLDLLRVRSPLISAMFAVRSVPERASRLARRSSRPSPVERLTFDDGLPGWVRLGESPGRELCFGAVGVFWTGVIKWREVSAADFAGFDEPGYGKIAVSLTVQPYGPGRSIVSYEFRTGLTDERSRQRFRRYWATIRPFVGHLMRATVSTIARDAEAGPSAASSSEGEADDRDVPPSGPRGAERT